MSTRSTDEQRTLHIVDLEVGPYSPAADIRAEVERIEALPASAEREMTLAMLRTWQAGQGEAGTVTHGGRGR